MHTTLDQLERTEVCYHGLRMTAEEYFALGETLVRYELIDGVVCMSPSSSAWHQRIAARIMGQITEYLERHPVGEVYGELDVELGAGPMGGGLVYRPDIVFLGTDRAARNPERIREAPELIVEVISPLSQRYDRETKKGDYERFGVTEYWVIDPKRASMTFYRLEDGRYVEVQPEGDSLASRSIAGFVLDLARVRKSFRIA